MRRIPSTRSAGCRVKRVRKAATRSRRASRSAPGVQSAILPSLRTTGEFCLNGARADDIRLHNPIIPSDQRCSIVASQAWAPLSSIVTAKIAGSIDLIDQPSTKAARSSACDTRRGPQSPGWRSLKHIR